MVVARSRSYNATFYFAHSTRRVFSTAQFPFRSIVANDQVKIRYTSPEVTNFVTVITFTLEKFLSKAEMPRIRSQIKAKTFRDISATHVSYVISNYFYTLCYGWWSYYIRIQSSGRKLFFTNSCSRNAIQRYPTNYVNKFEVPIFKLVSKFWHETTEKLMKIRSCFIVLSPESRKFQKEIYRLVILGLKTNHLVRYPGNDLSSVRLVVSS